MLTLRDIKSESDLDLDNLDQITILIFKITIWSSRSRTPKRFTV